MPSGITDNFQCPATKKNKKVIHSVFVNDTATAAKISANKHFEHIFLVLLPRRTINPRRRRSCVVKLIKVPDNTEHYERKKLKIF